MISVSRCENFNVVRRLHNSKWSDAKNLEVFGKYNSINFYGQSFDLIVTVSGEPNLETSYVYDIKLLSELIKKYVLSQFDGKNLNLETTFFKGINPTIENMALVIWEILRLQIDPVYQLLIKINDTKGNYVEYPSS